MTTTNADKIAKQIKEYGESLQTKMRSLMEDVLKAGQRAADMAYGGRISVTYEILSGSTAVLSANGAQVCFLEFGTGELVDTGHPYANTIPGVEVYPGSWSKDHKRTYQRWEASNGAPGTYEYNTEPTSAMYKAYEAMYQAVKEKAREVFGRGQ